MAVLRAVMIIAGSRSCRRYVADYKLPAGAADAMAGSLSTALQEVAALLAAEQQEDEAKRKRAP